MYLLIKNKFICLFIDSFVYVCYIKFVRRLYRHEQYN